MRKFKVTHRATDPYSDDETESAVLPWSVVAEEQALEPGQDWRADDALAEGAEVVRLFKITEVLQLPDMDRMWPTIHAYELPRNVGDEVLVRGRNSQFDVLSIEAAGECMVDVEEVSG